MCFTNMDNKFFITDLANTWAGNIFTKRDDWGPVGHWVNCETFDLLISGANQKLSFNQTLSV